MASKRRNMFYENKKQETTEIVLSIQKLPGSCLMLSVYKINQFLIAQSIDDELDRTSNEVNQVEAIVVEDDDCSITYEDLNASNEDEAFDRLVGSGSSAGSSSGSPKSPPKKDDSASPDESIIIDDDSNESLVEKISKRTLQVKIIKKRLSLLKKPSPYNYDSPKKKVRLFRESSEDSSTRAASFPSQSSSQFDENYTPSTSSQSPSYRKGPGSNLIDRPPNISRPETPPLNLETISQTLKEKNITPSKLKFGFLGLGIMGSGIVKNLLNSGHKVVVWNRTPEKICGNRRMGKKRID
ncbi:hypothetical protein AAG570_007967 [Ranatra chinensis]|uniref:6-phosphogluconate dehydrogenase NADP-binding domain-containing protein n=1 Tax=Ranatra chinensis TaxID=642074 RepID=A0ABD0XTD6_9HEMI